MWEEPESKLDGELREREQLLWYGRPKQGIRLRAIDALLIPFSLMWCGFAIFWEVTALTMGAPFFFALWGIPFVLVGLYFVFGRFLVEAKGREKTYYGVTDERIIIVSGLFSRKVKSLNLRTLSDVSLTEKADGSGTITFGPTHPMAAWFAGSAWPGTGQYGAPSFEMIDNARDVYYRVVQAQKAFNTPPADR